MEFISILVIKM